MGSLAVRKAVGADMIPQPKLTLPVRQARDDRFARFADDLRSSTSVVQAPWPCWVRSVVTLGRLADQSGSSTTCSCPAGIRPWPGARRPSWRSPRRPSSCCCRQGLLSYIPQCPGWHRRARPGGRRAPAGLRHVQRLPLSYHDYRETGELMTRLTGDISLLQDCWCRCWSRSAAASCWVLGMWR